MPKHTCIQMSKNRHTNKRLSKQAQALHHSSNPHVHSYVNPFAVSPQGGHHGRVQDLRLGEDQPLSGSRVK